MLKKYKYLLLSVVAVAAMVATVTLGTNVLDQATASVSGRLSYSTTLKTPTIWSPGSKAVLTNYPRTTSLSWSYVTGATSYEIEIACDTCVSSTNLYSSPATYTSTLNYYITQPLAGDNTFRFRVRAKSDSSTGRWTSYRYFSFKTSSAQPETPTSTTLGTPTISAPASNEVLTNYPRTAYLAWSYVTGATSYEIEMGCDTCVSSTTLYSSPTTYTSYYNYYTTPALAGDNTFRFRVRAKNDSTTGSWTGYRYFSYKTTAASTTLGTPTISTPASNEVLTNYPRTAYLDWSTVSGATSYEIEIACDVCVSSANPYSSPTTYTSYYSYYTTPALAGDNTFRFKVRAKNASSTGGWSDYSYFSYKTSATLGTPTISAPASNAVLTDYPRTADLSWSTVTGATSYEIEIACDVCVSSTNLYSSPTTYTSYYNYYTTPALAGDNTFRFKVRAKSASSTGAWSDYSYFSYKTTAASTTLGTPTISTPTSYQVLTNYPRIAYLDWSTVSGATSYEIEIACDVCVSSANPYSSPTTYTSYYSYYTTPALAGDNTFRFKVRAKNASSTGGWSDYQYFSYSTPAD